MRLGTLGLHIALACVPLYWNVDGAIVPGCDAELWESNNERKLEDHQHGYWNLDPREDVHH